MNIINIKHMSISQVVKSCFTLHPKTLDMIFTEVQQIIPNVKKNTVSQICYRLVRNGYADINEYKCFVRGWRFKIIYNDDIKEIRVKRRNGFPEHPLYFHDDCIMCCEATIDALNAILSTLTIVLDLDTHDFKEKRGDNFKGLIYYI